MSGLTLAIKMLLSLVLCTGIGYALDIYITTLPLLTFFGAILGLFLIVFFVLRSQDDHFK